MIKTWMCLGGIFLTLSGCGGGGGSGPSPPPSAPLAISPVSIDLLVNSTTVFTASGGTAPYTFAVSSGGGIIDSSTGQFTAPGVESRVVVEVTDSAKKIAAATVSVLAALTITPAGTSVGASTTTVFSAKGGRSPYAFSVVSGSGTIDSSSGSYTAPAAPGSAVIKVLDTDGNSAQTTVTINPALAMTPTAITITAASNYTYAFSAQGGVPPYTYSVVGPGSVDALSGLYTAGTASGPATLQVRDAQGSVATSAIASVWVRANAPVRAVATDGSSLYLGGDFTSVNAYQAAEMIALDSVTGNPNLSCNVADGFNGNVRTLLQTATTIYAGGDFTKYRGAAANHIAKIDSITCSLDAAFSAVGTDQAVSGIALMGNALFVVGEFSAYGGAPAQHLAKIDATSGVLDTVFTQPTGVSAMEGPAVAVSSNAVYVAGFFTAYRGQSAPFLIKLDPNTGAIDPTFNSSSGGLDGKVTAIVFDGQSLYAAGDFLSYRGTSAPYLLKIDAISGALDTAFTQSTGIDNVPSALAVSASSLYVGGLFSNYRGTPVSGLIKLDKASGALDASFAAAAHPNDLVTSLLVSGTALYVGGDFNIYGTSPAQYLARVDAKTGALDTNFTQSTGFDPYNIIALHHVDALSLLGSSLLVGGSFTAYRGTLANHVAKIDMVTGLADAVFNAGSGANLPVYTLLVAGDSVFIGGGFNTYRDQPYEMLVKVDKTSGVLDSLFNRSPGFSGPVESLALSGTTLYAGGFIVVYGSTPISYLAKLDSISGNLDTAFMPQWGFGNPILSIQISGTSIFAGGESFPSLAKLDAATGQSDPAYAGINTDDYVRSVLTSGSSVFFAGIFQHYNGTPVNALVKVDAASGAIDTTFTQATGIAGGQMAVNALAASQNSLYAGGGFQTYRNAPAASIAKIDVLSGLLDTTFSQASGPDGPIYAISPLSSTIWIAGDFRSYRSAHAYFFAPLDSTTGALLDQ